MSGITSVRRVSVGALCALVAFPVVEAGASTPGFHDRGLSCAQAPMSLKNRVWMTLAEMVWLTPSRVPVT